MLEKDEIDLSSLADELRDAVEDAVQDAVSDAVEDAVESAVEDAVDEYLASALREALTELEFHLSDGTVVCQRPMLRILSPDRSRQLVCWGGLRINEKIIRKGPNVPPIHDGWRFELQTAPSRWEVLAHYPEKEQALAALAKVKAAQDAGLASVEL